jgi:hypothetical protein
MSKANGWLLISGVIVQMVGWAAFYPANPGDATSVQANALRGDEIMARVGLIMGFGGMIAMLAATVNVARSIQSTYASHAAFILTLAAAGALVSAGIEFSVVDAPSASSAASLMGNSLAIGNGLFLGLGVATVLLGIAILLTKQIYLVIGAFAVLFGVAMVLMPFFGNDSPVAPVAFLGWCLVSIGIGFHSIRTGD